MLAAEFAFMKNGIPDFSVENGGVSIFLSIPLTQKNGETSAKRLQRIKLLWSYVPKRELPLPGLVFFAVLILI